MDRIKTVKIKNPDGSVSEETYTISVDAKNVDMDNGKELQETIGTINVDMDGNIAEQLNILKNNEIKLNKKPYYYNTVADMRADLGLKVGDMAITLGYYEMNDGGNQEYFITNIKENDEYQEEIDNGLYGNLIKKNKNNMVKFKNTTGTMQAGNKRNIATEVGMKWVRMSFVWEACEIEKGVIDDAKLQGFVNNFLLYKNLGVNTLALLCFNNTNYVDHVYDAIESQENLEGFVNFCKAVANKLKDNDVIYLIWNEPNGDFWRSNNKEYYYVRMIKEVSKAIKEIDCTAKIAGPEQGGINYYSTSQAVSSSVFFENCCKEGLLNYVDYISYHAYYGKESEKIIDINNSSNIFLTKGIASKYSFKDIPIIITEFGGSTWSEGLTEEEQARGIVKSYIINNAYDIKISSQYSFLNTGDNINEKEDNFGMAYTDGTLKQSGKAVKFLLSLIGDYYFNRIEKMDYYDDYCFIYNNGEKKSKEIYCLWTTATDEHIITLKSNLIGCELYDMYGNKSITNSKLLITHNPQYIKVLNSQENNYIIKDEVEKMISTAIQEKHFGNELINNDSQIGMNNILNNSDFSFDKKYITDWVGTSQVILDSSINDKVLEITSTGQGSFFNNAYQCNIGDILTWSCWVKADQKCNISIGCEDGETWSVNNYTSEKTGMVRYELEPNQWKKITKTFVVSKNDHHNFLIFTQSASSENPIKILLYHPQIVKAPIIKNDFSAKSLDYEFGTFIPKLTNPQGTSEVNYTNREGHYYKIGNLVYFDLYMTILDNNSLIGTCLIAGIPYAPKYRTGIAIGNASGLNINPHTQLVAHTYPNSKTINIKKIDNTGNSTDITFGNIKNNATITLGGTYYTD